MIPLTEKTFLLFAAKHYDNPHCLDVNEFYSDVKRFNSVKRLLNKYHTDGVLKERMILNHLMVLYNIFNVHATSMLFFKVDTVLYPYLKPFILLLGYLPPTITMDDGIINTGSISMDLKILEVLKKL